MTHGPRALAHAGGEREQAEGMAVMWQVLACLVLYGYGSEQTEGQLAMLGTPRALSYMAMGVNRRRGRWHMGGRIGPHVLTLAVVR